MGIERAKWYAQNVATYVRRAVKAKTSINKTARRHGARSPPSHRRQRGSRIAINKRPGDTISKFFEYNNCSLQALLYYTQRTNASHTTQFAVFRMALHSLAYELHANCNLKSILQVVSRTQCHSLHQRNTTIAKLKSLPLSHSAFSLTETFLSTQSVTHIRHTTVTNRNCSDYFLLILQSLECQIFRFEFGVLCRHAANLLSFQLLISKSCRFVPNL